MKLCDFCAPFYSTTKSKCGIRGKTSQPAIAEFFVGTSLGDFAKIELVFSDDLFRKWFKGEQLYTQQAHHGGYVLLAPGQHSGDYNRQLPHHLYKLWPVAESQPGPIVRKRGPVNQEDRQIV